jgi:hypothetical protein
MLFSKRQGFRTAEQAIQLNNLDPGTRAGLWDAVKIFLWDNAGIREYESTDSSNIVDQIHVIWHNYFKLPLDTIPHELCKAIEVVRQHFFEREWFEVYDFIEFIAPKLVQPKEFESFCNRVLTRDNSGYRFVGGMIAPISSETELKAIDEAVISVQGLSGIKAHLLQSLEHLSNRTNPDYRNAIKEAVSSVEGICQYLTGDPKATLGQAISILEKNGAVHPALKASFSSLYGYTNDADGIRHAMLDEAVVTFVDAKFMLVTCSAFVNYALGKAAELGIKPGK